MYQDTLLAVWDAQLELLSRIAVESGLEAKGHAGSRIAANTFSEALAECVTLDSAAECMRSDPEGARVFLHQASEFNWLIYDRNQPLPSLPTGAFGPFPLVCFAVTEMLKRLQEFDPANLD
jgi:ubiquinone biosynthesis protein Coq4